MEMNNKELIEVLRGTADMLDFAENRQNLIIPALLRHLRNAADAIERLEAENTARLAQMVQPDNNPLTLEELREMVGEPVWVTVLDRPDLSRWHFVVHDEKMGVVAKDSLGIYEAGRLSGCYFDIENGHNYGVNWLAYHRKQEQGAKDLDEGRIDAIP